MDKTIWRGPGRKKPRSRGLAVRAVFLGLFFSVFLIGFLPRFPYSLNAIPQRLVEFARNYPEAAAFVTDYPWKKDREYSMDLSSEVRKGTIPLFLQWDERWGYQTYGSGCLGLTGCGPTCLSMVVCGLTGSVVWNPYKMAQFSEEEGYYVWGSGTSWSLMTDGARALGLWAEEGTISADYILSNLSAETPMIASMTPGDFTYSGHFIVLTGINKNGEITVHDPNSPSNSEKTWTADSLVSQMKGIWRYRAEADKVS